MGISHIHSQIKINFSRAFLPNCFFFLILKLHLKISSSANKNPVIGDISLTRLLPTINKVSNYGGRHNLKNWQKFIFMWMVNLSNYNFQTDLLE